MTYTRTSTQKQPNVFKNTFFYSMNKLVEQDPQNVSRPPIFRVPITVNVDGCLMTGEMISYHEYIRLTMMGFKNIFQSITNNVTDSPPVEFYEVLRLFDTMFDIPCALITEMLPPPEGCIWLNNVRIHTCQPNNSTESNLVLEVEIDRISTFVLGHLI